MASGKQKSPTQSMFPVYYAPEHKASFNGEGSGKTGLNARQPVGEGQDADQCSLHNTPQQASRKSFSSLSRAEQVTKRRMRTKFTPAQVESLETSFEEARYPSSSQRQQMAKKLGLSDLCVQVWFQNRRARVKPTPSISSLLQQTVHQMMPCTTLIAQHPTVGPAPQQLHASGASAAMTFTDAAAQAPARQLMPVSRADAAMDLLCGGSAVARKHLSLSTGHGDHALQSPMSTALADVTAYQRPTLIAKPQKVHDGFARASVLTPDSTTDVTPTTTTTTQPSAIVYRQAPEPAMTSSPMAHGRPQSLPMPYQMYGAGLPLESPGQPIMTPGPQYMPSPVHCPTSAAMHPASALQSAQYILIRPQQQLAAQSLYPTPQMTGMASPMLLKPPTAQPGLYLSPMQQTYPPNYPPASPAGMPMGMPGFYVVQQ